MEDRHMILLISQVNQSGNDSKSVDIAETHPMVHDDL